MVSLGTRSRDSKDKKGSLVRKANRDNPGNRVSKGRDSQANRVRVRRGSRVSRGNRASLDKAAARRMGREVRRLNRVKAVLRTASPVLLSKWPKRLRH